MKTVITVENGRVTVQVDNEQPINVSTPLPAPVLPIPPPETQKIEKAAVQSERHCTICNDLFQDDSRKRICDKCRREKKRHAQQRWYDKQKIVQRAAKTYLAEQGKKQKTAKEKSKDDVGYCRHCCAWTTHDSEHHPNPVVQKAAPQFLPGHEKTPEEIASWKPAVSGVMPSVPNVAAKTGVAGGFADPWNCDSCRRRSKLCPFHQGMADEGKQPPSHKVKRKV